MVFKTHENATIFHRTNKRNEIHNIIFVMVDHRPQLDPTMGYESN